MTDEQMKAHRRLQTSLRSKTVNNLGPSNPMEEPEDLDEGAKVLWPFRPNWKEFDRPLSPSEKYLAWKIEQALPITPSCSDSFGTEPFQIIKNDSPE